MEKKKERRRQHSVDMVNVHFWTFDSKDFTIAYLIKDRIWCGQYAVIDSMVKI